MSAPNGTSANDPRDLWPEINKLLRSASACVPLVCTRAPAAPVPRGELVGTLDEFEDFLEHNELELAWDTLASLADSCAAPAECWRLLAQAAGLMGLVAKQERAVRRMNVQIPAEQALAIARKDGETAYHDLSSYRITLSLEADGWHVDYELKNPHMNGGGPHFLIDRTTGKILWKRYDQ